MELDTGEQVKGITTSSCLSPLSTLHCHLRYSLPPKTLSHTNQLLELQSKVHQTLCSWAIHPHATTTPQGKELLTVTEISAC